VLLLQAMMQLGKTTGAVGEEIVHRHFQPLLSGLQLAQQLLLMRDVDKKIGVVRVEIVHRYITEP